MIKLNCSTFKSFQILQFFCCDPPMHGTIWTLSSLVLSSLQVWSLFILRFCCVTTTYIKNFRENFPFASAFKIVLAISISSLHNFTKYCCAYQSFVFYFFSPNSRLCHLEKQFDKVGAIPLELKTFFPRECFDLSITSYLSEKDGAREKMEKS